MTNRLNARIKKLIKQELLDYGKHLLGFLGVLAMLFVLPLLFLTVDTLDIQWEGVGAILNLFSVGSVTIIMFLSGITTGSELPQYVRRGIARIEYFMATTIAMVIVNMLIGIVLFMLNLGNDNSLILTVQILMGITLFLLGFLLTIVWQRIGWVWFVIGMGLLFIFLGILGWDSTRMILGDGYIYMGIGVDGIHTSLMNSNRTLNLFYSALVMIALFGSGTYLMIKKMPIKTR